MGRLLVALAGTSPDFRVAGAVESREHPAVGEDAGALAGCGVLGVRVGNDLGAVVRPEHVVIDFTVPAATLAHARVAAEAKAALIVGTTGLDAAQDAELRRLASTTRSVIAANYSV